jgi:AbrB family looped-hinge helix DNA binding protein
MKTTIDKAGRLVVPKPLREQLGVQPGQLVELEVRDGRLEVELLPVKMHLRRGNHGLVAVSEEPLPALTQDQVRVTLERARR